ncbi:RluA family pseudouridine synthase [Psychrobacter sp. FDAARGOS_221]|uniref:RluA family pseudouridine synthase n=1 Tax=Psychrobacter sp. FDAARGOS_221 TaxID=1975705 RepID=UPI001D0D4F7F|nr:RluA family pseudouridine synthase [Psychrobacter sp. FDAARGOS_221]
MKQAKHNVTQADMQTDSTEQADYQPLSNADDELEASELEAISESDVDSELDDSELDESELDDGDIEDDDFSEPLQGTAQSASSPLAAKMAQGNANGDMLDIYAEHTVTEDEAGERIDKLAAELFADHSRAQLQDWLKSGNLQVNGKQIKAKYRVKQGDQLLLEAKLEQHSGDKPENIDLDVLYEDDSVVVINKPVGMVVHPGAGNWTGTLVNGLLYHYPNQAHLPRAGLVHRIDKNTSGLLVIGKTKAAQLDLQDQLRDKSVYRHYQCVVAGDAASLTRQRTIDEPIGRHRVQRTKMTVTSMGKPAVTHIMKITALNENYSLLDVRLETGRTHQIRVHLSHIGHPIIGDNIYGNRKQLRAGLTAEQRQAILDFPRQALHAYKLGFIHPVTGEAIEVTAPLPEDIVALTEVLSDE